MYTVTVACVVIMVTVCFILFYAYTHRKNHMYTRALTMSKTMNKPLMVVGDPRTGTARNTATVIAEMDRYGYGDVCVDLTGCPFAPPSTRKHKGDLLQFLNELGDDTHVIFISEVLEYLDNIDVVINALYRVSGGHLYIVKCGLWYPQTYPDKSGRRFHMKQRITHAPPYHDRIRYYSLL